MGDKRVGRGGAAARSVREESVRESPTPKRGVGPKVVARSARQTRSQGSGRSSHRAGDRTVANSRTLTDQQRLDEFRKTFYQSILPDLPPIPGFHVCWLTTTNPRDPIVARLRLGYEPVTTRDVPGWEYASVKTGEYAGCIGVNEMVAFKLPEHLYEAYMYEAHHVQPLDQEQRLSMVNEIKETAARAAKRGDRGIQIDEEQGQRSLGRSREPPSFSDTLDNRDYPE